MALGQLHIHVGKSKLEKNKQALVRCDLGPRAIGTRCHVGRSSLDSSLPPVSLSLPPEPSWTPLHKPGVCPHPPWITRIPIPAHPSPPGRELCMVNKTVEVIGHCYCSWNCYCV